MHLIRTFAATAAAFLILIASSTAHAQLAEIEQLLQEAMEHYDMLELDQAESKLYEAIELAEAAGIEDPVVAQCHIMLGIVIYVTTKDEEATKAEFKRAVEIDPNAEIDEYYSTPTLTELFAEAASEVQPDITDLNGDPPKEDMLRHSPVEYADAFEPIEFKVVVPVNMRAAKVYLYLRPYGDVTYQVAEMYPLDDVNWYYKLSGERVNRSQIDYYIEVVAHNGVVIGGVGTDFAPFTIVVFGAPDDDVDQPPVVGPGNGDKPASRHVTIFIGAGSGLGVATGRPVLNSSYNVNPGMAPAPFHLLAELTFHVTPMFSICGFARIQLVESEQLFGGKVRFNLDDEPPFLFYLGVGGGYGEVRHTVDLSPALDFVDTTLEGPGHAGLDVGISYDITDHFSVVAGTYIMVLFDVFSVHIDLNVGVATWF